MLYEVITFSRGHFGMPRGEEFFFLEFDALPWRVAQHAVKSALGKDLGKGQGPVEHAGFGAALARGLQLFDVTLSGSYNFV